MKIVKTLKAAALLAVASSSMLHATVTSIFITGPTSFRASTINAIANILTSPAAAYSNGTSLTGALQATISGTYGGSKWVVYTSFVGSEDALKSTSQTTTPVPTLPFLTTANAESAVTQAVAPAVVTGGTLASNPVFENVSPQVTFSDEWQASSQFHGTVAGTTYATLTGPTEGTLTRSIIAASPYKIIASAFDSNGNSYQAAVYTGSLTTTAGSAVATLDAVVPGLKDGTVLSGNSTVPSDTTIQAINGTSVTLSGLATTSGTSIPTTFTYEGLTDLSVQLAKKTFTSTGGVAVLSQFTGSNADNQVSVYAVGRNHDSGTRSGFVLETGIDKAGTGATAIQQYYPLDINGNIIGDTGAGSTIEDLELVPAETVNGVNYSVGESGYSTGSSLAKVFTATNALPNSLFITYLGISDAKTALGGNAQELSYDGVYYSPTAVQQGKYTLWTYEHLYYKSGLSSTLQTFANAMASQVYTSDASVAGTLLNSYFVASRIPVTTDGALVTR